MQGTTVRLSLLAALALAVPAAARADGVGEDARAAYDRGTAAHARRDYRAAASEFARADALAPNPVALKAALDEALLADDPELAMQLVERARVRANGDASLGASVGDATRRFAGRTGRVRVDCGGRACGASIDARAMVASEPMIVLVGPHRVTLQADGGSVSRDIVVQADRETDVVLPPPPAAPLPVVPPAAAVPVVPPPRSEPRSSGLSPVWFAMAGGITAVVGGGAIASGIDTSNQHSTFASRGCSAPGADSSCSQLASDGKGAQLRTDVLAAATGALGITTIALAFLVRWRAPSTERATTSLVLGDRSAALRVLF